MKRVRVPRGRVPRGAERQAGPGLAAPAPACGFVLVASFGRP